MSPTVYLVTGANRGIGLAFVRALAARPNSIVFAGARNPDDAIELRRLAAERPSVVYALKIVSADEKSNKESAAKIEKIAGKVDVVIANAGIGNFLAPIVDTPLAQMREHFEVNTLGTFLLFQTIYPLLKLSANPKFISISSVGGSVTLGTTIPVGLVAIGCSKSALNWMAKKIHIEHPDIVSFPVMPGAVDTDLVQGQRPHTDELLKQVTLLSPAESASKVMEMVDVATRESHGGKFMNVDGTELPW